MISGIRGSGGARSTGDQVIGHGHAGVDERERRRVDARGEEGSIEREDGERDMDRRVRVEVREEARSEGGSDGGLDLGNATGRGRKGELVDGSIREYMPR